MPCNQVAKMRSEPGNPKSESGALSALLLLVSIVLEISVPPPGSPSLLMGRKRGKPAYCHLIHLTALSSRTFSLWPFPSLHPCIYSGLAIHKNSNNETLFLVLVSWTLSFPISGFPFTPSLLEIVTCVLYIQHFISHCSSARRSLAPATLHRNCSFRRSPLLLLDLSIRRPCTTPFLKLSCVVGSTTRHVPDCPHPPPSLRLLLTSLYSSCSKHSTW